MINSSWIRSSLVTAVCSTALGVAGCASAPPASSADAPAADTASGPHDRRAVVSVDGMFCPFCTYNVERQLRALDGVDRVDVSLDRAEAYVTLSEADPATAEQLRRAVESAGFTANRVEMP